MRIVLSSILVFVFFLSGCGSAESPEEYLKKAKQYQDQGGYQAAIIEYKNAIRLAPDRFDARVQLGNVYMETGQFAPAAKEFRRALELGGDKPEVMIPLARAYLSLEQYEPIVELVHPETGLNDSQKSRMYALLGRAQAYLNLEQSLASLEKAKNLDDQNSDVRLAWASYEGIKGNSKRQKEWLSPLIESDEGDPDAWSQLAGIEKRDKNIQAAIDAYSHSIRLRSFPHPDLMNRALLYVDADQLDKAQADIDTLVQAKSPWIGVSHISGIIAIKNEDWVKARGFFQKVLSSNPDYAPSQYFLAIIETRENNLQSALSLLEQYVDRIPNNTHANLLYADILIKLNKLDKAQGQLKRLYNTDQGDPRILVMFGRSYLKQNKIDQAVEYFRRSIQIDPQDAGSRLLLGKALLTQSKTKKLGRQELEKALQLEPAMMEAYNVLFLDSIQEKEYPLARATAARVKDQFPKASTGGNMEALSFLQQGDKDQAISLLKQVLEKFPKDPLTSQNLAKIHLRDGDYASAKQLYEGLLLHDPSNIQVLSQLALIAAREGDKEKTLQWIKQAADKNPDELAPKLMLAAEYIVRGQAKQADLILVPLEHIHGNAPEFLLVMSQAKIALKDHQKAIRLLKTLVSQVPNSVTAHVLLARIYQIDNELANLRIELDKILELDAENFEAQLAMARLELLERNKDAFKSLTEKLARSYPSHPGVMLLKAALDASDRDYQSAIENLSTLMNQKPSSGMAKALARNYWMSGERDKAISVLEVWKQSNPDDANILSDLAQYYAVETRDDEALQVYARLNELNPNNPTTLNNLAWLLQDIDVEQALEYGKRSQEIDPKDLNTLDTLSVLYLKDGQAENALIFAQSAFQAAPGSEAIQLTYARALIANNQMQQAKRILERILQSSSAEDMVREARAALEKI
jgi:putative PEP-CTERM system TPR-repeat lipoprotein